MFEKFDPTGFTELIPGIQIKVVGHGTHTLSALFTLEAGKTLPLHDHVYEQTGTLLEGQMRLTIEDETFEVTPGDTWTIPPNVPHMAEVLAHSRVFEVFSPPRSDYLKLFYNL